MLACMAPLRELTIFSLFFRFFLATGCSAVIGYERSKNRHAAGLRTHIVVCIGAASVMLLNQYYTFFQLPCRFGPSGCAGDQWIGFLGAGTIVITGHQRGQHITTAAGL